MASTLLVQRRYILSVLLDMTCWIAAFADPAPKKALMDEFDHSGGCIGKTAATIQDVKP